MIPYQYIAIEGNIGAGKTSLATMLATEFNSRLVLEEFAENPFLRKFYESPDRYAFPLELSFLSERFSQLKREVVSGDIFRPQVISDYFLAKCQIFAKNNLQTDEYALFLKLYGEFGTMGMDGMHYFEEAVAMFQWMGRAGGAGKEIGVRR